MKACLSACSLSWSRAQQGIVMSIHSPYTDLFIFWTLLWKLQISNSVFTLKNKQTNKICYFVLSAKDFWLVSLKIICLLCNIFSCDRCSFAQCILLVNMMQIHSNGAHSHHCCGHSSASIVMEKFLLFERVVMPQMFLLPVSTDFVFETFIQFTQSGLCCH